MNLVWPRTNVRETANLASPTPAPYRHSSFRCYISPGTAVLVTGRAAQEEWETKDGQKRRSIKVTADEVAPSLRFATCKVAKVAIEASG